MKKIFFTLLIGVFMITGCGAGATKTMKCTYQNSTGSISSKTTYNIDYENNDVKKVRVTYNYHFEQLNDIDGDGNNDVDGVGTGTDGTTNDTQIDNDGIIDGVVGSAIDSIVSGVTGTILDISGLRDRHATVQNTYGSIPGFSIQNTTDNTDNDYTVSYIIDYDTISDTDLGTLNLSRDIDTIRSNFTNQGFTCSE